MDVAQDLAQTNKAPLDTSKGDRESTHVLETFAPVVLQQTVLAAKVAPAEVAVTDEPLLRLLAVGCGTSLLGSHVDVSVLMADGVDADGVCGSGMICSEGWGWEDRNS